MGSATDQSQDAGESVSDFAIIQLKESFALLLCEWRRAIETKVGVEPVHQLRVASRRFRAAIELFADLLPRRKSGKLLAKIDDLRKSAGPVRDRDVLLGKLEKESIDPEMKQTLAEFIRDQRIEAHSRMRESYYNLGCGEILEEKVTELLAKLRPRGCRNEKLDHCFPKWVRNTWRQLNESFFKTAKIDSKQLDCLHQLRIRSKQFRYTLDILQPTVPNRQFDRAYSGLKKLSQRLGKINDHASTLEILARLRNEGLPKPVRQYLLDWQKKERQALRHRISEFDEWWTSDRRRVMRRRLKKASEAALLR